MKKIRVKVIGNAVGFVKGEITEVSENVLKAYGKGYFEKVKEEIREEVEEKEIKTAKNKAMKKGKAKTK